ncbi:hypothetical protein SAMN05421676_108143 [Salinibacillus kushneri]|uniref:Uncharacterized protein n=1 Tax=Salinibacillus kushneri TaxID=237682 RepID=A0A1I0HBF2_9BACI|nr:hypothetical protein SAMN05421676_108143 [Salinibacillus kushneri]
MKRNVRLSEKILLAGYAFILLFMIVQDWVPLGSLNDIAATNSAKSSQEIRVVTLIGVGQIVLLIRVKISHLGKDLVNRSPNLYFYRSPVCMVNSLFLGNWGRGTG